MRLLSRLKHPAKTALAATVSLIAYQGLHLSHGYWAVISAVIVMESNLGRSMLASASRLVGTAIGAAVGAVVYFTLGRSPPAFFLAICITLYICVAARLEGSMRLAGVTTSIVMLIGEESAWRAGLDRFADVALGVIAAVSVSLIWPSRARDELRRSLARTYTELGLLFNAVIDRNATDHRRIETAKHISLTRSQINHRLLTDVEREPGDSDRALVALTESASRIRDHLYGIDYSARPIQGEFYELMEQQFRNLFENAESTFELISARLEGKDKPPPTLLREATIELEARFKAVRISGATRAFGAEEILRSFSLVYRLRQLVNELERSIESSAALTGTATNVPALLPLVEVSTRNLRNGLLRGLRRYDSRGDSGRKRDDRERRVKSRGSRK